MIAPPSPIGDLLLAQQDTAECTNEGLWQTYVTLRPKYVSAIWIWIVWAWNIMRLGIDLIAQATHIVGSTGLGGPCWRLCAYCLCISSKPPDSFLVSPSALYMSLHRLLCIIHAPSTLSLRCLLTCKLFVRRMATYRAADPPDAVQHLSASRTQQGEPRHHTRPPGSTTHLTLLYTQ